MCPKSHSGSIGGSFLARRFAPDENDFALAMLLAVPLFTWASPRFLIVGVERPLPTCSDIETCPHPLSDMTTHQVSRDFIKKAVRVSSNEDVSVRDLVCLFFPGRGGGVFAVFLLFQCLASRRLPSQARQWRRLRRNGLGLSATQ